MKKPLDGALETSDAAPYRSCNASQPEWFVFLQNYSEILLGEGEFGTVHEGWRKNVSILIQKFPLLFLYCTCFSL